MPPHGCKTMDLVDASLLLFLRQCAGHRFT